MAAAQRGADPTGPLDEQQPDRDLGPCPAHQPDLHDRALRPHGLEVAVGLGATDDVEDGVDAVRTAVFGQAVQQGGEPVGRRALDDDVGTERAAGLASCRPST